MEVTTTCERVAQAAAAMAREVSKQPVGPLTHVFCFLGLLEWGNEVWAPNSF
jgi:hypothetical protein